MIKRITAPSIRPQFERSWLPAGRYALMVVAIVFATLVAYLYVVRNSEISASTAKISQLKADVAALERENASLLGDIAVYSDMKFLEQRATQLGMAPARGAVYLKLPAADGTDASATALTTEPPLLDEAPMSPGEYVRQLDLKSVVQQVREGLVGAVDGLVSRFENR